MHAEQIEIGRQVRLFTPLSGLHGRTGTITKVVHYNSLNWPVTVRVSLDGVEAHAVVHVSSLRSVDAPLGEPESALVDAGQEVAA